MEFLELLRNNPEISWTLSAVIICTTIVWKVASRIRQYYASKPITSEQKLFNTVYSALSDKSKWSVSNQPFSKVNDNQILSKTHKDYVNSIEGLQHLQSVIDSINNLQLVFSTAVHSSIQNGYRTYLTLQQYEAPADKNTNSYNTVQMDNLNQNYQVKVYLQLHTVSKNGISRSNINELFTDKQFGKLLQKVRELIIWHREQMRLEIAEFVTKCTENV